MGNPVFSRTIAELTPIPEFIRRDGLVSLPFRLHLVTMALGALSFLVPLVWVVLTGSDPCPRRRSHARESAKVEKAREGGEAGRARSRPAPRGWRLSPFRLLLFGAFSVLSWQATRNSHQFAAVVGSVTAWNFARVGRGRAAAALGARGRTRPAGRRASPRGSLALAAVAAVFAWVATGRFYEAAARGGRSAWASSRSGTRTRPSSSRAGAGMPDRFLGFHIGHASLYEY